jgi:hypothetical protein
MLGNTALRLRLDASHRIIAGRGVVFEIFLNLERSVLSL